jgi:hypothetical protein
LLALSKKLLKKVNNWPKKRLKFECCEEIDSAD